jgi:hypothetical protein
MAPGKNPSESEPPATDSMTSPLLAADAIRRQEDAVVLASASMMAHDAVAPAGSNERFSSRSAQAQQLLDSSSSSVGGSDHAMDHPPSPLVTPPGGRSVSYNQQPPRHALHDEPLNRNTTRRRPYTDAGPARLGEPVTSRAAKPVGIPHIYHDYGQVPDVDDYVRKKTGGVTQPFPEKLHEMLNTLQEHHPNALDLISWLPHGRAFLVHRPKEFTRDVMPK